MSARGEAALLDLQLELASLGAPYTVERFISSGSYGAVCAGYDTRTRHPVAVKRVHTTVSDGRPVVILQDPFLAKRVVREVLLLHHFSHHPAILGLRDVFLSGERDKLYLVTDLMHTDLSQIIADGSIQITAAHVRYFMFRILVGLAALHSAGVVHRDLHPANILVAHDNDTRICDFNLAREDTHDGEKTHYVTHRWYRAPELVMQYKGFTKVVDVWSAGCIMAELYNRRPLFRGSTFFNQLNKIVEVVGTPRDEDVRDYSSSSARSYLRSSLANCVAQPWSTVVPKADPVALDLLSQLLQFDPRRRIGAEAALRHPFFAELYREGMETAGEEGGGTTRAFHFDENLRAPADLAAVLARLSDGLRRPHDGPAHSEEWTAPLAGHVPRSSSMVSFDLA